VSYIYLVNKHTPAPVRTVRNAKTGEFVTVRGVGALKGALTIRKGVDLTRPIAAQAVKRADPGGGKKR
jgi:hypothetical protein